MAKTMPLQENQNRKTQAASVKTGNRDSAAFGEE
jgi:hypothetical protein